MIAHSVVGRARGARDWQLPRAVVLAAVPMLSSCTDRPGGAEEGTVPVTVTPATTIPATSPCRTRPGGVVLSEFSASRCTAALLRDDAGLVLWRLDPDASAEPARGAAPQACGSDGSRCTYVGHGGPLGPLVLALAQNPESEMPAGVWLGAALDDDRTQLVFIDLWAGAGDAVVGDGTVLGPSHSLAPFVCGGNALALFSVGRLPAARGQTGPPQLLARQGVYAWADSAAVRSDVQRDRCTPIAIELP